MVAFAALRGGIGDIFTVDLDDARGHQPHQRRLRRLRADLLARRQVHRLHRARQRQREAVPPRSRHRRRRRSSPSARTTNARRSSSTTTRWSSRRRRPTRPSRSSRRSRRTATSTTSGRSNLKTGELRQYTDALGGNLSADRAERGDKAAADRVRQLLQGRVRAAHARAQGAAAHGRRQPTSARPGPIIDFQAPLTHTLVAENKRKKGTFEKMFLDGRPPVNVGVTSSGDVFGGTQVTFSDVLGDKQFNLFAASISQYRTLSLLVREPVAPLPVRAAGLLADAVLLRAARAASSTIRRSAASSTATSRWRRAPSAAAARSASTRSTATAASSCRRRPATTTSSSTTRPSQDYSSSYQQQIYGTTAVPQRHVDAARRGVRPGDDGLPRVRSARRQHDAARLRRRAEDRQHALAPDVRRRRALLPAARRHRPAGAARSAASRARAMPRLHVLRRQLRDARLRLPAVRRPERRRSPTPSCASR